MNLVFGKFQLANPSAKSRHSLLVRVSICFSPSHELASIVIVNLFDRDLNIFNYDLVVIRNAIWTITCGGGFHAWSLFPKYDSSSFAC